jgi:S-(hydroxymethyl)glutathione dehydrogenase / alcohol dehydrogenase
MARISRRNILKTSAAAAGAAFQARAQTPAAAQPAPTARRFKAFVRFGTGTQIMNMRLLPIQPREVVIRTQASAVCYTITGQVLGTNNTQRASIPNHSGMGVVEEIGSQVRRVSVGDRVVIPGTPQCGVCYHCLQGRADWCQFLSTNPAHAIAVSDDGNQVFEGAMLGGLSEIMVVTEEYCCPVFTDVPAAELCLLGDTAGTGLAAGHNLVAIQPGDDVVVLGAGPVGLGAVQSARIAGATQIISVEPIKTRRDLALKLGATLALDPNAEGTGLVEKIRELCKGKTANRFAGGRAWGDDLFAVPRGPDVVIEAVGGDSFPPKVEVGPDPTGILSLQQAYDMTRAGGHIVTLGFAQRGNVSFPASSFANRGRTFHAGQQGGLNMMRDIPRYVRMIEKGLIDAKSMISATYPLERTREAVQAVADRTVVGAVITFS